MLPSLIWDFNIKTYYKTISLTSPAGAYTHKCVSHQAIYYCTALNLCEGLRHQLFLDSHMSITMSVQPLWPTLTQDIDFHVFLFKHQPPDMDVYVCILCTCWLVYAFVLMSHLTQAPATCLCIWCLTEEPASPPGPLATGRLSLTWVENILSSIPMALMPPHGPSGLKYR